MIVTLLAGYPAAGIVAVGGAVLLAVGHVAGMLWILLVVLALLLVQVRNWFGLWSVLVSGLVLAGITWWGTPVVQGSFAVVVVSTLATGSVRTVLELQRARSRRSAPMSDADQLARLTRLPGVVWVAVMLLITVLCAATSGWLLITSLS